MGGVFSFALPLLALLPAAAVAAQFSFGVVPQHASELAYLWTPILSYLGEKTSLKLEFRTAKDIPTFERRLAAGEYDFAYMNPYHYVVFHDLAGYQALAKEKERKLVGLIVIRKNSPFHKIAELNGTELALPAPGAFAASILPLAALRSKGIFVKPRFVSSHDSVYLSVAKGFFSAAEVLREPLKTWSHRCASNCAYCGVLQGIRPMRLRRIRMYQMKSSGHFKKF